MNNETTRILVVDDERGIREGCQRILTLEGYEVETAEDGIAGLELFKERGNFAAALIDLKMPRMDGIELIKRIHEQDKDIVLFVITAYATIETAVEATRKGAYSYIPKPFTPDELLLPVKQGLERRALLIETRRLREEREAHLLEVAFERSKCGTIIKCMTDGVLVINRDGQLVLQNAASARMLMGYATHPLSAFILKALDCDDMEALITRISNTNSGFVIESKELVLGQSTYMMNVSPVTEALNEETLGIVVVLRDITALKKLETAKSSFVSMVAHEVKSPLVAIEGYLNLILRGEVRNAPEKEREILEKSLIRIGTLRTMLSELINLTTLETGNFTLKRSRLDIVKVISEVVESYQEKAQQSEITLSMTCEQSTPEHVFADELAMQMVFTHLIDNALKYTLNQGHVWIQIQRNADYVSVKVKDDGIGMTPEEKASVFDEFFRVKNECTAHILGTGLGLSLVKRLLEMHHGMITLETSPGKGSEFIVSIPVEG